MKPDDTATGDIREQQIRLWTSGGNLNTKLREFAIRYESAKSVPGDDPDYYVNGMENAIVELFHSYKQQVLDELEGRLPTEWQTRPDRLEPTNRQLGYNDCLTEVHQVIAEMRKK